MKTYRCLWGMSTENHYILYFAVDCRISLRNPGHLPVESSEKAARARVRDRRTRFKTCENNLPRPREQSTLRDKPLLAVPPIFRLAPLAEPRKA